MIPDVGRVDPERRERIGPFCCISIFINRSNHSPMRMSYSIFGDSIGVFFVIFPFKNVIFQRVRVSSISDAKENADERAEEWIEKTRYYISFEI